jgi:hypothetical protein
MANPLRRLVQLVLDRRTAQRTEKDAQEALRKGTDPRQAEKNVGRVNRSFENLRKVAVRLGAAIVAAFGVRAITNFVRSTITAYQDLRREERLVEQQVENMGRAWADAKVQIDAMTASLWHTHRLTGGEIMKTFRELLVATNDYELSMRNVGLVHDIAAATGMDVSAASRLLGRAIQGNTTGFARYGIVLDDTRDIIEQLRERTEGMALAGTSGAEALAKAWGDFKEELGGALNEMFTVEGRTLGLADAVRWLTENMRELVAAVVNLTKAIMVAGAFVALQRLRTGLIAANAAAITLKGTLTGFLAILGPKGWFILAVGALTVAFQKLGKQARDTARLAQESADMFTAAIGQMDEAALRGASAGLRIRQQQIAAEIDALKERIRLHRARGQFDVEGARLQAELAKKQGELEEIDRRRLEVVRRRQAVEKEAAANAANAADDEEDNDNRAEATLEDRIRLLRRAHELGVLTRDERLEALEIEDDILGVLRRGNVELSERVRLAGNLRDLADMTGSGLAPTPTTRQGPQAPGIRGPVRDPGAEMRQAMQGMRDMAEEIRGGWWAIESAAYAAAWGVSDAWRTALGQLAEDGANLGDVWESLMHGMAAAGLGAVSAFAQGKVQENVASAIENVAKGISAASNPLTAPLAGGFFSAAAQHGAAATAWAALAGGSAAGQGAASGAARGGMGRGMRDPAGRHAEGTNPGAETHIYIDGFDPHNPHHVKKLGQGIKNGSELGHVTFHPRGGR